MSYTPNFNERRTKERIKRAIRFVVCYLSADEYEGKQMSSRLINKELGQVRDKGSQLGRYLRDTLLITTSNKFRFGKHHIGRVKCKEYIMNQAGVHYLLEKIGGKDTMLLKNSSSSITTITAQLDSDFKLSCIRAKYNNELSTHQFSYSDKSNRLSSPIQHLPKEVKRPLLAGSGLTYEYDIESCAPTLIYQYAKQNGLKSSNVINDYLTNKTAIRARIAKEADIPLRDAKQILTALFAGAQIDQSISKILQKDKARIIWFKQDEFITALRKDISKCWRVLREPIGVRYNKDNTRVKKITASVKMAVYFSLERKVLDVIREELTRTHNKHFLEHDGWTCERAIDRDVLSELIESKTGFCVKFSEEVIDTAIIACV